MADGACSGVDGKGGPSGAEKSSDRCGSDAASVEAAGNATRDGMATAEARADAMQGAASALQSAADRVGVGTGAAGVCTAADRTGLGTADARGASSASTTEAAAACAAPGTEVTETATCAPAAAPPATAQPGTYANSYTAQTLSGVNTGIASVAGAPVDLAELALNGVTWAARQVGVPEAYAPHLSGSFGGSQHIRGVMEDTGSIVPPSADPNRQSARAAAEIATEIVSVAVPAAAAARASAAGQTTAATVAGTRVADPLTAGFEALAAERARRGLPVADSDLDRYTMARIELDGREFFGVNRGIQSPLTEIRLERLNAITRSHAEADVIQQVVDALGPRTGGRVELFCRSEALSSM